MAEAIEFGYLSLSWVSTNYVKARWGALISACRYAGSFDARSLSQIGVRLIGRLAGITNGKAQFAGSLRNICALSDLKMGRLLDTIDTWARNNGLDETVEPPYQRGSRYAFWDITIALRNWVLTPSGYRLDPPKVISVAFSDIRNLHKLAPLCGGQRRQK